MPEYCKLKCILGFAMTVVISNLVKVVRMFLTLWRHEHSALMTIRDGQIKLRYKDNTVLMNHLSSRCDAFSLDLIRQTYLDTASSIIRRLQNRGWQDTASTYRWAVSPML